MVGTEVGGYRIGEKIGEGSLGVVYKAVQTLLHRDVAIKVFHEELVREPDFLVRVRSAIRESMSLNHPNIAICFDFLTEGDTALVAMEYVDGDTFEQLIARRGPMSSHDAIALFRPVLLGIGFAHRQGVLHGGITTRNLMVTHRDAVKVMDFGFAKALQAADRIGPAITPELLLQRPLDHRSDIYLLGVTLYQMLTTHAPFESESDVEIMAAHVKTQPELPTRHASDMPKHVERAIMRALEKDPDARFQTVDDFIAALDYPTGSFRVGAESMSPEPAPPQALPPSEYVAARSEHFSLAGAIKRGIEEIGSLFRHSESIDESKPLQTPELPGGRIDRVHFSVTAPQFLAPARSSEIYVWAYLDQDRAAVIQRAREAIGQPITVKSKGPVALARGVTLTVVLRIDGLSVENPEETILWDGEIGNASFIVTVPHDAAGERKGSATFYAHGLQIARLNFVLEIGASPASPVALNLREQRINKAFASYASPDRDEVLARIQGIQKAAPGLEIFLDVLSLRSGQHWETELRERIPANDVFYLFWSANAKNSEWVEKEWRCALETRGLEFIDPVPLVAPELAPPPAELSSRHFNDWVLAFRRKPQ